MATTTSSSDSNHVSFDTYVKFAKNLFGHEINGPDQDWRLAVSVANVSDPNNLFCHVKTPLVELVTTNYRPQGGLFALRDIEPGELITYYPPHVLVKQNIIQDNEENENNLHEGEEGSKVSIKVELMDNIGCPHGIATLPSKPTPEFLIKNGHNFDKNYGFVANPSAPFDPKFAGHLVNEVYDFTTRSSKEDSEFLLEYQRRAIASANCKFIPASPEPGAICCQLECRAVAPICKGEEVATMFGLDYWLDQKQLDGRTMAMSSEQRESFQSMSFDLKAKFPGTTRV